MIRRSLDQQLMTIHQKDNSLALRIKHFNGVMHGWEEKDVPVDFALKKIDKNSEGKLGRIA